VALASAVDVMDVVDGGTSAWTQKSGTSYAAPAMAAMAAMLKEECDGNIEDKYLRAIMMTGAWFYNPDGAKYSTSQTCAEYEPIYDCVDGAGSPAAQDIMLWCGSTMSGLTVDGGSDTLLTNDCDGPCGTPATAAMDTSGDSTDLVLVSDGGGGVSTDGVGTSSWYYQAYGPYTLHQNDRIRATVVWDTCTDGTVHPSVIGNDIDLWLCPTNGDDCVAWSRSYNNNWEGFDWTKTSSGTQAYEVRVGYDSSFSYQGGDLGCTGDGTTEPIALATVYGASSSFDEYSP
jgi:hypothetical protein